MFGIDIRLPDMLYAAVVTCRFRAGRSKAMTPRPSSAIAACTASCRWRRVSPSSPTASGGRETAALALPIERNAGVGAGLEQRAVFTRCIAMRLRAAENAKSIGDAGKALADGKVIEALCAEVPYLAHATMEPLNCTVHLQPDRLDVWMGTQAPDVTIAIAAKTVGLKPDQVYIHNCYLGGGFGRRAIDDEMMPGAGRRQDHRQAGQADLEP